MRFASHEFDSMTHVLSESDDSLDAAGAAITSLGVGMDDLSISVDPTKRPMLDPAVLDAMLKMMEVVSTGGKKRERKKIDRVPATSGAKAGSGHGALFPVSISNETGRHFYRLAVGT